MKRSGAGRDFFGVPAESSTRRTGLVTVTVLLGTVATALVLARVFRLGVAGTLVTVLVGGGAPAALYLAWAGYRDARQVTPAMDIGQLADQLAKAVGKQWEQEAAVRRLYDPYPLRVSWAGADPALTDDWDVLEELAGSVGWAVPTQPETWAHGTDELAGEGDGLAAILAKVPTRRMVVLGEPGAGKTMLMVRLVLSMLEHRSPGDPVPLLMPLASWNPGQQDLHLWLRTQMCIEHPDLAARAPAETGAADRAEALLAARRILPVLDGLDEIPGDVRGSAIARINDALLPGEGVVVTSRTAEYRAAVRPGQGPEITLRAAAAIQLDPLDTGVAARYLLDDAGGPVARARWAPVIDVLGTQAPVALALATPLMIGLARIIYNPRPGELPAGALQRQPAELLGKELFPTKKAVENHLFDSFVWAAYRPRPGQSRSSRHYPCSYDQARRWLVFLARNQESRENGTLDISWWKLSRAAPKYLVSIAFSLTLAVVAAVLYPFSGFGVGVTLGLLAGIAVRRFAWPGKTGIARGLVGGVAGGAAGGLIALIVFGSGPKDYGVGAYLAGGVGVGIAAIPLGSFIPSIVAGLTGSIIVPFYQNAAVFHSLRIWIDPGSHVFNGIGIGLAAVLTVEFASHRELPAYRMRWSPAWFVCGVGIGLMIGFITWLQLGQAAGLAVGLAATIAGALIGMITGTVESDPAGAEGPRAVLRRDRATFLGSCLVFGVGLGLITGVASGLSPGPTGHPNGAQFGLEVGLANIIIPGLGLGFIQALWGTFLITRCWLALTGNLPGRLMTFLHDAHVNRGVLRQVGAVYQFRHIDLQRRMANWPSATSVNFTGITNQAPKSQPKHDKEGLERDSAAGPRQDSGVPAPGTPPPSGAVAGVPGGHVFISYVTEDTKTVDSLQHDLERAGVTVWRDRSSLGPGDRWKDAIRRAISSGGFFLCCFSEASARRTRSYMNEELTLAIEELRVRSREQTWFLPVVLPGGEIPDWPIGGGETLRDFNYTLLSADTWSDGVRKLLQAIQQYQS